MAFDYPDWLKVLTGRSRQRDPADAPPTRVRRPRSQALRRRLETVPVEVPRLETSGEEIVVGPRLAPARSWGCQYQAIDPVAIAASTADVIVLDPSPDGSRENFFSPAQVEAMRTGPGGRRKRLIGYMSIGEAEYCRFYWQDKWLTKSGRKSAYAPRWLDSPNDAAWEGNWKVRFWDPGWQDIIISRPGSFLNRIIDRGYDGVFLDVIDAYAYWTDHDLGPARRPTAAAEMVSFVRRIAQHARETRGMRDFAIMPINGVHLLKFPQYRAAISVLCSEDLFFDQEGKANANPKVIARPEPEIEDSLAHLRLAIADRIPVLGMEYLLDWPGDAVRAAPTQARMRSAGIVPHFCKRRLANLSPILEPEGDTAKVA